MTAIAFTYQVGDQIECRDIDTRWRPACVVRLAPYRGRPGYYIDWTDIDWTKARQNDAPRPSSGGWTYELCMRRKEVVS
jgi:hypothetical protein